MVSPLAPGEPVLLGDPRILAVPVHETGEALVRLDPTDRLSVAGAPPPPPIGLLASGGGEAHAMVRAGLATRLRFAAIRLPPGIRLHVVEGYRPLDVQREYFDAYRRLIALERPGVGPAERHALASRFVAPPEVAAHPSGAAVDVTLVDDDGVPLDLGTPVDATPEASDGACYTDSRAIGREARANRGLLADCLLRAGLVNYPTEWWHWSHGDRYWAFVTGHHAAIYGANPLGRHAAVPSGATTG